MLCLQGKAAKHFRAGRGGEREGQKTPFVFSEGKVWAGSTICVTQMGLDWMAFLLSLSETAGDSDNYK